MSEAKLKLAPLKEVIFELQWAGGVDTNGNPIDDGFDLAQGKLAEKLKIEYPVHKKLIPDGIPFRIFGVPLHQYWKDEFKCPVIQHGSGILAVNDVEINYEWEQTYKPIVISAINSLINSYDEPIKFNKAKLQYIDAWDYHEQDPKDFVKSSLRTVIESNYPLPGNPKNFNIFQSFELEDGSEMQLTIANAVNNNNQKPSVIWTTTVEKKYNFKEEEIVSWLEDAHTAASNMFKKMLNPEFYASLD